MHAEAAERWSASECTHYRRIHRQALPNEHSAERCSSGGYCLMRVWTCGSVRAWAAEADGGFLSEVGSTPARAEACQERLALLACGALESLGRGRCEPVDRARAAPADALASSRAVAPLAAQAH